MKKFFVLGLLAGVAAGAAAAIAGKILVDKIVGEIKNDLDDYTFTSPDQNNSVTISYGTSETAKGLTFVRVKATSTTNDDDCKLIAFARKADEMFYGEWSDNEHFQLLVGNGKCKQCCDVAFDQEKIVARYYLQKAPGLSLQVQKGE